MKHLKNLVFGLSLVLFQKYGDPLKHFGSQFHQAFFSDF